MSATTGVAVGADGLVMRTSDAGSTWTTASAPTRTILNAIDMVDAANGWAVGGAGIVLRTRNGGVTWTKQSTPTRARLTSVHFLDTATGWAAGESGTVLRTTNAGATWTLQSAPTTAQVGGVRLTGSSMGWVVGGAGTILRATVVGRSPFGSVAGRVTDAVTGAPVSGAKVYIGGRPTTPSAVDGSFVAARLVPGTYGVRFTNPRYITRSGIRRDVRAGRSRVHDHAAQSASQDLVDQAEPRYDDAAVGTARLDHGDDVAVQRSHRRCHVRTRLALRAQDGDEAGQRQEEAGQGLVLETESSP